MSITAIRGFNDILPEEAELWRRIEEESVNVFASYGFSEIKAPYLLFIVPFVLVVNL